MKSAYCWLVSGVLFAAPQFAQSQTPAPAAAKTLKLDTGKEIYEAACIACHGAGGKGAPQSSRGFEAPKTFPDFSDCDGSMREFENDYRATIYYGGHGRGFNEIMPSFAEALTMEQINKVVQHLRSFCEEKGWPKGELNFPRAIATEKAFPEDEAILTTSINVHGAPGVSSELVVEKRFAKRNNIEFSVPFAFTRQSPGTWFGGIGDLRVGLKRVMAQDLRTGTIFSVQGEMTLPTGNKSRGLGTGTGIFETFGALGQMLPGKSFVQTQAGAEFPTNTRELPRAVFWRTALGKQINVDHGLGRGWTPMMEFLADRDIATGAKTNWDVLPQFQVTLNKRQHIRASMGVRIPANNTAGRSTQFVFYLLWDTFDGGLFEGWK
ncbi:MAG TPA: c-type cytochrome [Bryobacteraceae bacterium]|nr:c-type cytochrome [Bryobacteraceae bacterium]